MCENKSNKGFTLIELLATIAILALVVTIAYPLITDTIDSVRKKSFELTASGLVKSARIYYGNNLDDVDMYSFSFDDGKQGETTTGDKIYFDGDTPTSGFVNLYNDGSAELNICNAIYCACKGKTSDQIFVLNKDEGVCGENEDGTVPDNPITASILTGLQDQIDQLVLDMENLTDNIGSTIYPVGAIYISVDNTNPSTLFGGTWVAYAEGRTLIGAGTGTDTNTTQRTFANNQVGGEYTHTLTSTEMPGHTHTGSSNSTGDHTHTSKFSNNYSATGTADGVYSGTTSYAPSYRKTAGTIATQVSSNTGAHSHTLTLNSTGGDTAHNVIQPYITVYMWKRTA